MIISTYLGPPLNCYDCIDRKETVGTEYECGDFGRETNRTDCPHSQYCMKITSKVDGIRSSYHGCGHDLFMVDDEGMVWNKMWAMDN